MRTMLINARKLKNLTQKRVADKVGISERFYQSLEYGTKQAGVIIWDKLEDLLEVSHRVLMLKDLEEKT